MKLDLISLGVLSLFAARVAPKEQNPLSSEEESPARPDKTLIDPEDNTINPPYSQNEDIPSSNFPWTHKPICGKQFDEFGEPFCVYTNASFSDGRGISILTTPGVAEKFATLPPFQNSTALSSRGINVDADPKDRPWYTVSIPGKGIGMRASRPLQRGDLITAYTPVVLAHIGDSLFTEDREKLLRLAVEQLPVGSRDAYLDLAKIYDEADVIAQDVLKANGFDMEIGALKHGAVFPEASRYNHACAPNAQYFFAADLLTHYVHAVRPIEKDEEITISYAPPLRLHAQRQEYFQSVFGFTCTCARCSPETHTRGSSNQHHQADASSTQRPRTVEDSDRATQAIASLQWELSQWTSDSTASVKKAEQLVQLYEAEGLQGFMDLAYGHAALTYNGVGSLRGAKKYAGLAAEATWLKYGFDANGKTKVEEWEAFASDPMGHATWRARKG